MSNERYPWAWKRASTPEDVLEFLNGTGAYHRPVKDAKISAVRRSQGVDFYVFYRTQGTETGGGWGWKRAGDAGDVKRFLSGAAPYRRPVTDARICSARRGDSTEFFVFYRRTPASRVPRWGWKKATTADDVASFLSGSGAYRRPVRQAEVCATWKGHYLEFHVFYLRGTRGQPQDSWSWVDLSSPGQVMELLDRTGDLPSPARDGKLVACAVVAGELHFYAFKPRPFLIVSRPLFDDALDGFVRWKEETGFEVHVVTAEWIRDHVTGADLRVKIRNAIRAYRDAVGLEYAMLVGDSLDILPEDEDATEWEEPPEPVLSEDWNLPAGYYRWDCWVRPQYTTLYWADLTDKVHYAIDEQFYTGSYELAVAVVPVREPAELRNVLAKIQRSRPATRLGIVYSEDLYSEASGEQAEAIDAIGGAGIDVELQVFGSDAAPDDIHAALFASPGALLEHGHGSVESFVIGGTSIGKDDALRFRQVNPLYALGSCLVQAYHLGECLDEAFLKRRRGPATVCSGPPWGWTPPGEVFSPCTEAFWRDLLAGRPIGDAFCGNSNGAYRNPQHLFGDPSLVVFAT